MFGISNMGIWLAFLLCIVSAGACVVYGIVNWNKGSNDETEQKMDAKWKKEEQEIEEKI